LVENGADINRKDLYGYSPLDIARGDIKSYLENHLNQKRKNSTRPSSSYNYTHTQKQNTKPSAFPKKETTRPSSSYSYTYTQKQNTKPSAFPQKESAKPSASNSSAYTKQENTKSSNSRTYQSTKESKPTQSSFKEEYVKSQWVPQTSQSFTAQNSASQDKYYCVAPYKKSNADIKRRVQSCKKNGQPHPDFKSNNWNNLQSCIEQCNINA
jgi:hypothetical protein